MSECGPCTAYEDRGSVSYVIRDYDPKNEFCQYKVPTIWINKKTKSAWYLVSKEGGNCEWIQIAKELGGFIKQILTQCGTIEPDENGRVEFCAQNGLYVGAEGCGPNWLDLLTKSGLSGGGRVNLGEGLTFSLDFATNKETITGEMETKPISPVSLSAKLGEQTESRFAIGNGKTNALSWGDIVSPLGTISTFYDAANKQFNIDVDKKTQEWREKILEEEAVLADAEDRCIYIGDALYPIKISIKSKDYYSEHAQFYVISLAKGWHITFIDSEEDSNFYMNGEIGTSLKSSNNEPHNMDYAKLTFIKSSNIWLVEAHSSDLILD